MARIPSPVLAIGVFVAFAAVATAGEHNRNVLNSTQVSPPPAGGASGQAIANAIDPCHASSVANAALFAGLGGAAAASLFPVPGMYTLAQAQHFAPRSPSTMNNSAFVNAAGASAGVGAASNFGGPF